MTPIEWIFGLLGLLGSSLGIYSLYLQLKDRSKIEPKILQLFQRVTDNYDFLIQVVITNLGNKEAENCQVKIYDSNTDNQLDILSFMPVDSPLGRMSPDWPSETDFTVYPKTQITVRTYLGSSLEGHQVHARLYYNNESVDRSKTFTLALPSSAREIKRRIVEPPIRREGLPEPTYPSNTWEFLWFEYTGDNTDPYGNFLKQTTLAHINFDENWEKGEVNDSGRFDRVCFKASRKIHLFEPGERRFLIGGDDGIRLTVFSAEDDSLIFEIVELWRDHPYEQFPRDIILEAGEYKLLLEWYEVLDAARASFSISSRE